MKKILVCLLLAAAASTIHAKKVKPLYKLPEKKETLQTEVIENSMLTVDFINSLGITAKKITVLQHKQI